MLSLNFKASEFIRKGSAPVTTLDTVMHFQKIRNGASMPVVIRGSELDNGRLLTTADIRGYDPAARPAFRHIDSVGPMTLPVYGDKAAFSDSFLGFMNQLYSKSTLGGFVRNQPGYGHMYAAVLAMLQTGYREKDNNDNIFGSELGLNKVPWCALFYHWIVKQLKDVRPDMVYDYNFDAKYSNSRYMFERAPESTRQLSEIRPGYAVVWARNNNTVKPVTGPGMNKRAGHTGVCVYNDPSKKLIIIAEGNSRDGVHLIARYWRNINSRNLEFVGGCTYIKPDADFRYVLPRDGSWSGAVKEDLDSQYE